VQGSRFIGLYSYAVISIRNVRGTTYFAQTRTIGNIIIVGLIGQPTAAADVFGWSKPWKSHRIVRRGRISFAIIRKYLDRCS
jgi:hypothetical protein